MVISSSTCPVLALGATDAQTLTGATTPLQTADYSREINGAINPKILPFQKDANGKHGYKYLVAPAKPNWQFATTDPTAGQLSALECDVAPEAGWHSYVRSSGTSTTITHSKVVVTGGHNAAKENIYTVFNGQQLIAAFNEAGLKPKIVRVVGHIDLRYSQNNSVFKEYTSYTDQKYGGSINIPSNTTLVGINDANGNPARITGTTILIGGELPATAGGDPEADFKAWIAAGKDGDLYPTWTRNVILRNLKIDTPWDVDPEDSANGYADGMTISRAQNIWIDHISLSDGDTPDSLASDTRHDGNLDIVRGADYVTVSNTFFGDHGKNSLVGNGDSGRAWSDENRLHVTFNGLWWYGIASRHPLVRFGQLHSYNNLMQGSTNTGGYGHKFENGLDVRYQSSVFSENNFHLFTGLKPKEVCGKLSGGSAGKGFRITGAYFISDKDNNGKTWATSYGTSPLDVTSALAAASCSEVPAADIAWTPPYSYTPVCASEARRQIEINTGAGRIGLFAKPGNTTDSTTGCTSSSGSASSSSSSSSSASSSSSSSNSSSSSSSSSSSTSGGSSLPGGVSSAWSDDFVINAATSTTLFTAGYAALPNDSTKPMYSITASSKTPTVDKGVITMPASTYLSIGALGSSATSSTSSPGGVFNLVNKTCTLTITFTSGFDATAGGHFIVLVDNNTSKSGDSMLGSVSKVKDLTSVTAVDTSVTWKLDNASYTQGSFLTLRTDSKATVSFSKIALSCI